MGQDWFFEQMYDLQGSYNYECGEPKSSFHWPLVHTWCIVIITFKLLALLVTYFLHLIDTQETFFALLFA